jgi:FkbM family methyltransferase
MIKKLIKVLKNPIMLINFISQIKKDILINYYLRKADCLKSVYFIQIGSNDGISGDPIRKYILKYDWRGILVEPVDHIFKKLKLNYKGKQFLKFENVAISNKSGEINFYRTKNDADHLPIWHTQIGSINKSFLLKHKDRIPEIEKNIICDKVQSETFEYLIKKYSIKNVDVIHIDAEGHDFEILKLIPIKKLRPRFIYFESMHLSKEDCSESRNYLKKIGYKVVIIDGDTIAHRRLV